MFRRAAEAGARLFGSAACVLSAGLAYEDGAGIDVLVGGTQGLDHVPRVMPARIARGGVDALARVLSRVIGPDEHDDGVKRIRRVRVDDDADLSTVRPDHGSDREERHHVDERSDEIWMQAGSGPLGEHQAGFIRRRRSPVRARSREGFVHVAHGHQLTEEVR